MSNHDFTQYILIAIAISSGLVNIVLNVAIMRRVEHSQPVRVVEDVRFEMKQFSEQIGAFMVALDPDHITELVARHRRRFAEHERHLVLHDAHLVQHDGDVVQLRRGTDDLRKRVATLEDKKG